MTLEHILLFAGMLLGLAIIPFGLPGAIVILISILIYAVATNFAADVGVGLFVTICVLTVVAETADNWLTALGARRFGATSVSVWLSFIGGLAGAILIGAPLAFVLGPFGPIGGGFAGAFLIVFLYERIQGKSAREALRAGWGTFVGRMAGLVLKFVIAVAMIIAVAAKILL
jgi:uncharacterized protein YqgC (DUF456 family)